MKEGECGPQRLLLSLLGSWGPESQVHKYLLSTSSWRMWTLRLCPLLLSSVMPLHERACGAIRAAILIAVKHRSPHNQFLRDVQNKADNQKACLCLVIGSSERVVSHICYRD
jgi:hypothetical protein